MPTPLTCLVGFAAWTVLLVLCIAGVRVTQVLLRRAAPNAFPADRPHGSLPYQRLLRAHMNCVENLPMFTALVLTGHALGVTFPALVCPLYLAARVGQSCTHIASGRSLAVNIRFVFFATQLGCLGCLVASLWPRLGGTS